MVDDGQSAVVDRDNGRCDLVPEEGDDECKTIRIIVKSRMLSQGVINRNCVSIITIIMRIVVMNDLLKCQEQCDP